MSLVTASIVHAQTQIYLSAFLLNMSRDSHRRKELPSADRNVDGKVWGRDSIQSITESIPIPINSAEQLGLRYLPAYATLPTMPPMPSTSTAGGRVQGPSTFDKCMFPCLLALTALTSRREDGCHARRLYVSYFP